jgi:glucokinase
MPAMSWVAGFDIGGTHIKALAVEHATGRRLAEATQPTRAGEVEDGRHAWAATTRAQLATWEASFGPARRVGLSAPGLVAPDGRSIGFMPGRMQGLERFDWAAFLRRPRVPVLNDAHAALLGEAWQGAAAGLRDAVLITLGTGVGGGVLSGGRLLLGARHRAGHLGHLSLNPNGPPDICGTPGSLEDAIGEVTLPARSGGRFARTQDLLAAAAAGDAQAATIWADSVRALAAAVASLINLLDPEAVVIGGGVAQAGPALFDPLRHHLDTMEWRPAGARVDLRPAALGVWAGALGAARAAMQAES